MEWEWDLVILEKQVLKTVTNSVPDDRFKPDGATRKSEEDLDSFQHGKSDCRNIVSKERPESCDQLAKWCAGGQLSIFEVNLNPWLGAQLG